MSSCITKSLHLKIFSPNLKRVCFVPDYRKQTTKRDPAKSKSLENCAEAYVLFASLAAKYLHCASGRNLAALACVMVIDTTYAKGVDWLALSVLKREKQQHLLRWKGNRGMKKGKPLCLPANFSHDAGKGREKLGT